MKQTILATAAICFRKDRVMVTKRLAEDAHGDKWEFPGGKLEYGEDPRESLKRELKEELGVDSVIGEVIDIVSHVYPNGRHFVISFFECKILGEPEPIECERVEWVDPSKLANLDFLEADKRIFSILMKRS